jgi:acetyl-CoA acyltransferase 2
VCLVALMLVHQPDFSATDLAVHVSKAALAAGKVDPAHVDEVVFGNVVSAAADGAYMPRHVALRCDVPIQTPALGVNRLCGSGFQSAVNAYQSIVLGDAHVALVGGTESMSRTPHITEGLRFGVKLGAEPKLQDLLWAALTDRFTGLPMVRVGWGYIEEGVRCIWCRM